jgi:hypothetical protein
MVRDFGWLGFRAGRTPPAATPELRFGPQLEVSDYTASRLTGYYPVVFLARDPCCQDSKAAKSEAKARGCSESELIREGIEKVTRGEDGLDMHALIGSDIGIGHGPRDLSSSRGQLRGYGRSRNR